MLSVLTRHIVCCRTFTSMLGGRFRLEMPRRFGGIFRNDADHRDFTAIGTAAGEHPDSHSSSQLHH